ncbi:histidine phosphatase family protein [Bradyrhizobium sp.]|uniref:histidine phosphatase family protein n=1 Tax=Bradyrhizobium sp. TaxID=376 RepID=UPI002E0C0554|nr:histidine phosphatase family protein [Bradyrhizobium sp.]
MPTIYYMRHGETDWNVEGRLQGGIDTPLNELGLSQAAHAGRVLADLFGRQDLDASSLAFVASPLQRARVTMDTVRAELKLPPGGYALDDRLREIGYGHWEGSTLAQARVSHPELYASRERDKWGALPPGGESYASVQLRMRDWYDSLKTDTVAVAHGGTARALMVALGIETPAGASDLFIEQGVVYVFGDGGVTKYG